MAKQMTNRSILLCAVCFVLALAVAFSGVAYGRYNRIAFRSVVCGAPSAEESTLTPSGAVFDFGTWQVGQTSGYTHRVVLQNAAPQGTLTFLWDAETRQKADIALLPTAAYSGSGGVYSVQATEGRMEFPFELIFSSATRSGQAYVDVTYTPQGSETATHKARYLVALNPYASGQGQAPTIHNNTVFLTNQLLRVSASVPADCQGVAVAAGQDLSKPFSAGLTYYTAEYPNGVTLLKDSALYIAADRQGQVDAVVDYRQPVEGIVALAVGVSQSGFAVAHAAPVAAEALQLTAEGEPIVSRTRACSVTVQVADTLPDAHWNENGEGSAQLIWQVEKLQDGGYLPVELGEDLTATVSQTAVNGTVTLQAPTGEQAAGTYRLKCTQTYNGCAVATAYSWFFIDYRS